MAIYFDNGATSFPKAPGVSAAMSEYIDHVGANVNRSTYGAATDAAMTVLDTRERLCGLFGFDDPSHVVFTPGMTAGMNMLLKGCLQPGDHVIVSAMEHNATMRPLMQLAERGVEISRLPADRDGVVDASALEGLIRPNTRLVSVLHASNVCGTLLPVRELGAICKSHGIPFVLDAAQTAGHYPIDFKELNLSALCAPGHKGLLGPQGIGVLLMAPEFARTLEPLMTGGTGSASDSEHQPRFMPDRFESGTMNLPGIYGLNAALRYVASRGVDDLRAHELSLTKRFLDGLAPLPLRVVGAAELSMRVGVVSVDFTGHDNAEIAYRLESEFSVLTRCGLHCSPSAHKALGTFPQGSVRFSLGYASTAAEVDAVVAAVERCVGTSSFPF